MGPRRSLSVSQVLLRARAGLISRTELPAARTVSPSWRLTATASPHPAPSVTAMVVATAREVLNRVVGKRVYVGSFAGANGMQGNFDEAAERFRAWWNDAQAQIHWDDKLRKWVW